MSDFNGGGRETLYNSEDLSAKQYYIVKAATAYSTYGTARKACVLASAATDFLLGTLNNSPKIGAGAEVVLRNAGGTHKVKTGGAVTNIGDKLTADSAGKAVVTTTGADQILGYAAATCSSGDVVEYYPAFGLVR